MIDPGCVPQSLRDPALDPVWDAIRRHLDRFGSDRRGSVPTPPLAQSAVISLASLLGRRPGARLHLADVEASLVALGIADDLSGVLTALGRPSSPVSHERRIRRARSAEARTALDEAAAEWPEPWAADWAAEIRRSGLLAGLTASEATTLVGDARQFLNLLDGGPVSRAEIAAALFGSAHALDPGTRRSAVVACALRYRIGPIDRRQLWQSAGVQSDRVSAPALIWNLPVTGASPLDEQIRAANAGSLPVHLSLLALQRHPVSAIDRTLVLMVENPRVLEAAVERRAPFAVVAANGNPSTAVTTLVAQLMRGGLTVHYHGDFDAAGIGICRRMAEIGCVPWRMTADDYLHAVDRAEAEKVVLDKDPRGCGPTGWDPALERVFEQGRQIIHEEFVINDLLNSFERQTER